MNSLFPYDKIRDEQDKMLMAVGRALKEGGQLVVHAPTGLGKTAAALSPALKYAIENKKTVLFCTSRHTQHEIALETLKSIKEKHGLNFQTIDIIGKKWLCLQPNATNLRSKEFTDYCRALREDKECEYYESLRKGEELSQKAKSAIKELSEKSPMRAIEIKNRSRDYGLCPYELAIMLSKKALVIITDYNYVFNRSVSENFLAKINRELDELIIIVDEAHNLPGRVKESASSKLTSIQLQRALSEAEKYSYDEASRIIKSIKEVVDRFGLGIEESMSERYIEKEEVIRKINEIKDYDQIIDYFEKLGDAVREEQQQSYIGAIGAFLRVWKEGEDEGYTRILSESRYRDEEVYTLKYLCLDPSVVTGKILNECHASIIMSGTLQPTKMYKDLLGVVRAEELILESPFPQENRLALIVPKTTTKFTNRSEAMYEEIAEHLVKMSSAIPGNVAVFFPSYALLDNVKRTFEKKASKRIFSEKPGMSREEKYDLINSFKNQKENGSILMGVITGSYGEGIDLPGDELKGVVIVGLPLGPPDLETKALIKYFDNKYGRGWEYGYIFPAFNRTLQSAGRCIRTEKDRGVIIFLDERYEQQRYKECFPSDWKPATTVLYEQKIKEFFKTKTLDDY